MMGTQNGMRKHIIIVMNNLANEPARLRRLFRSVTKQATEANIPDRAQSQKAVIKVQS
jgi:hypothetical protein